MPQHSLSTESRAIGEHMRLLADPVYRGQGVPRGDGKRVLVIPGLFGNDFYLAPLRGWLRRIGYRPATSRVGINAGCPQRLATRVIDALARRLNKHDGEIAIIGHSRGGMLGKAIAHRIGTRCTRFIALGSPVGGVHRAGRAAMQLGAAPPTSTRDSVPGNDIAHQNVVDAGRRAMQWFDPDCEAPSCACAYFDELLGPWPAQMRVTAIYSTEDPVVAPEACSIDGAENHAIRGSHGGLVVNRHAYSLIARALL